MLWLTGTSALQGREDVSAFHRDPGVKDILR